MALPASAGRVHVGAGRTTAPSYRCGAGAGRGRNPSHPLGVRFPRTPPCLDVGPRMAHAIRRAVVDATGRMSYPGLMNDDLDDLSTWVSEGGADTGLPEVDPADAIHAALAVLAKKAEELNGADSRKDQGRTTDHD